MSDNTVVKLLRRSASTCMLLVLLMTNCLGFCGVGLTEGVKIPTNKNLMRPETTTQQGKMRGINMVTHHNRTIFGFLGIPYAQPPVGHLRFKAPVPAGSWHGTLDASKDDYTCPQFNDDEELVGDEDCLYHNVFTPQLPTHHKSVLLPVMVYVSGGGFKQVNNSIGRYGPDFLLDKDVLLVVPNFRVGVLGYLTTGDEVSPGNYGLKDVVLCLKWVRDNIRYFGGDPNRVTLFGGSSGAMSVHLLALSKSTDGLIHRYITQSGSALSNSVSQRREPCAKHTVKLAKYFGCPTKTSTILVNCLRGISAFKLVDTKPLFYVWETHPFNVWAPTTEVDIEGAVLTDSPANLYAAGKIRDLPWLATLVRDEGVDHVVDFDQDRELFERFLDNIDLVLPYMLDYQHVVDDSEVTVYTNALKSYYLNDLTADRNILLKNFSDLIGDCLFRYPVYSAVRQQHLLAKSPQYFGSFQYRGVFSFSYFYGHKSDDCYVAHGDELVYLFGHQEERLGPADAEFSETDWVMVDKMVPLWTSFATHGRPTTPKAVSTTVWEPYSSRNNYLRIGNWHDTALKMQCNLNLERMQFWDELIRTMRRLDRKHH